MQLEVRFYGVLRLMTGAKSVQLTLPAGAAMNDLLAELVRQFPVMQAQIFEKDGSLRKDMPLFLNGRNPRLLPGALNRVLQSQDVLSLFSPISSGRMNVEVLRQPAANIKEGKHEG